MRKLFMLACGLLLTGMAAMAQADAGQYDLKLNVVTSPTSSASLNQRVIVGPHNLGDSIAGYTVGVIKNGTFLFEEEVNKGLNRNEWRYDTLEHRVPMQYGAKDSIVVYVRIAQEDIDKQNDTVRLNIEMPNLTDFPMAWDATQWRTNGLGWKYNATLDAFYTSGRKTNMMGSASTVGVVNFPAGEMVTCKFDYEASITGTYTVSLDYGDSTVTLTGEMPQNTENFAPLQVSFVPAGPARVVVYGTLPLAWNGYGSIAYRNITFDRAILDVEAADITSPLTDKIALDGEPVTVKATFKNASPFDAESLKVSYRAGGKTVTETIDGGLKAGEMLNYTFAATYTPQTASTDTLTVWCDATGDGNLANDTLTKVLSYYEAVSFPFIDNFDEPNANWAIVDGNQDGHTWSFETLNGGNGVAYYFQHSNEMKDYLVTPAINMPQGRSRISFYYASQYGRGTAQLRVLMGKKPDVASMTEVLFDQMVANRGWLNAYHLIDLEEGGTYYFAFEAAGRNDVLVLDKLFIDRGEDICIDGITFDTQSGFNKTTSKVTISYKNHGVTPQKDIDVEYFVNTLSGTPVRETSPLTVQPGETVSYTFNQPFDMSAADSSYTVVGVIASKIGVDQVNDSIVGQTVSHYSNQQIPYYNDFSDTNRDVQWSFEPGNNGATTWMVASSFQALTNRMCLAHDRVTTDSPADDWAYSECIEIPKGEYEMSFFYRTALNWDTEAYVQNFSVHMGKEPTAQAMNTQLFQFENSTVGRPAYRKFINTITIPEDGKYYLGFHGYSPKNSGNTLIDCISLKPIESGKELAYESDFTNRPEEWTRYNYTAQFNRWEYSGDGTDSLYVMSRNNSNKYSNYEGLLVSPKLHLEAGRPVVVEVQYSLDTEIDSLAFCLYGSPVDDPDRFELLTSATNAAGSDAQLVAANEDGDWRTLSYSFTPGEDEANYFVALRSNTEGKYDTNVLYDMTVKSVKVYYDITIAVDDVNAELTRIEARNGMLTVTSPSVIREVTLYDLAGRVVERMAVGTTSLNYGSDNLRGAYIVRVTTDGGVQSRKVMF